MSGGYPVLMLAGIVLGAILWRRAQRFKKLDPFLYVGALLGAFLGAKIGYLLAEGWMFWDAPNRWQLWLTGKTVIGALIGGYLTVEYFKKLRGIRVVTGDLFASFVPLSIGLGRIGCLLQGCCQGALVCGFRWPAQVVEFSFNIVCVFTFWWLRRCRLMEGQHFHFYMMAYGAFRVFHEPLRATPKWGEVISGYQILAFLLVLVGFIGFRRRRRAGAHKSPD